MTVRAISYQQYKDFCSLMPSKDIFYFLKSLFIKYKNEDVIYGVKYNSNQSPENLYKTLESKNKIIVLTLEDFLSGLPTNEGNCLIQEDKYKDKNLLVLM